MKSDTLNMTITRVFDAPLEQVWKAWSTEEFVKQWWGPKGFTCPLAKMAFKESGVSLVCMRAPKEYGGQDMYNTWSYEKIEPMTRIEYVSTALVCTSPCETGDLLGHGTRQNAWTPGLRRYDNGATVAASLQARMHPCPSFALP